MQYAFWVALFPDPTFPTMMAKVSVTTPAAYHCHGSTKKPPPECMSRPM